MVEYEAGYEIAQLVASNYQAIYRYAFRLCGSVANAEDLTQMTFLIAQGNIGQLRSINIQKHLL